jgi:hypothetical protein
VGRTFSSGLAAIGWGTPAWLTTETAVNLPEGRLPSVLVGNRTVEVTLARGEPALQKTSGDSPEGESPLVLVSHRHRFRRGKIIGDGVLHSVDPGCPKTSVLGLSAGGIYGLGQARMGHE